MDNVADQKKVDRKRTKTQIDGQINETVIRSLMSHQNGRRWVWLFLEDCHIFANTIKFGDDGYAMTAFDEGKRALGLRIFNDVCRFAPQAYLDMTRENAGVPIEEEEDEPSEFAN